MAKIEARVNRIDPIKKGTTQNKEWSLLKLVFLVIKGQEFNNQKVELAIWGSREISNFQNEHDLNIGDIVEIDGIITNKNWADMEGVHSYLSLNPNCSIRLKKDDSKDTTPIYKYKVSEDDHFIHHLALTTGGKDYNLSLFKKYIQTYPGSINILNKDKAHVVFNFIKNKNSDFFKEIISHPNFDLKIKCPKSLSLWDYVCFFKDKNKAKMLHKLNPAIAFFNFEHSVRFNKTKLGKDLLEKKLILDENFPLTKEIEDLNSLESLILKYHPRIGPNGVKLVVEKFKSEIFINEDIFKFIQKCYELNFNIDHTHKMIKEFIPFDLINKLFLFEDILKANEVTLESFFINLLDDKLIKDYNKLKHYINDTQKGLLRLKNMNIELKTVITSGKINSLSKLHDQVSIFVRNFEKAGANRLFDFTKKSSKFLQIDNKQISEKDPELTIRVPKDTHTLCTWGFWMSNCVANYINEISKGSTMILGVFRGDELKINVEVRGDRIVQIYGKNNSKCSNDEKKMVQYFLEKEQLINSRNDSDFNFGFLRRGF